MNELPYEIKLTYIIAVIIMLLFVGFIIAVVFVYNKKQVIQLQENRIKEAEYQNQLLQKELEQQKIIQSERERISQDMHDDLGAGISAVKLQAEFLKYKITDPSCIPDIDDIIKTSEEMNISIRDILWSLNSNNDTIGNFIQYTIAYVENFLKRTHINFDCTINQLNHNQNLPVNIRKNLFLVVKECVNNTYKHSQATSFSIIFSQIETTFTIDVIDNGIGIPNHNLNKGNGLTNMDNRMKTINGKFEKIAITKGIHFKLSMVIF